jgi:predicted TIM-barrel fold metal-dependent hydrolase
MIVDFFTGIGTWPFRPLKYGKISRLIKLLKKEGIDRAVVYPISSILAKDCMEGNREVAKAAARYPSCLFPFACINPAFPGWKEDFFHCFKDFGFKGLRLFPSFHGYGSQDIRFHDIIAASGKINIPVVLSIRVEDERQHHWLVKVPPFNIKEAAETICNFPEVKFILSGATYPELLSVKPLLKRRQNWHFDTARMQGRHNNPGPVEVVVRAVEDFGAEHILFGSNAPFQYIRSSLLKIQNASISQHERDLLLSGNALRLLDFRRE